MQRVRGSTHGYEEQSPVYNVEDMSMYADADRFSVMINNKMDDFLKMENSGDSNSTADQDPVNKVLEKSKKLTEKHAKFTKQFKKQQN